MDWQSVWFLILGVLLFGYAVLDGFDFGVGMLQPLVAKTDEERRLVINSIGPLWDGNEVWLVTFGGALFAAFPTVYASVFSSFYLPFMLLLTGLIFRAVAIEFRSKSQSSAWRRSFDYAFAIASFLNSFLMGVAVGNVLGGLPIGERGIFQGGLLDLLNPYALAVGVMSVFLFVMHGAIYLYLKTEGDLQARLVPWMWRGFGLFMLAYIGVTIATLVRLPEVTRHFETYPIAWLIVAINVIAIANIPRAIFRGRPGYAFASSVATIAALVGLLGVALYPNLVVSSLGHAYSLTIRNASSSEKTLKIMTLMAAIGMPLVLAYTSAVYWTFRGKVKLSEYSY